MRNLASSGSLLPLFAAVVAASCDSAAPPGPAVFGLYVDSSSGGRVISSPVGIDCRDNCLSSSAVYPAGTQVRLAAQPAGQNLFLGWAGDCSGTGDCLLTMSADRQVYARFELTDAGVIDGGIPPSDGGVADGGAPPPDGGTTTDGGADPLAFPEEVPTVLRGVRLVNPVAQQLQVSPGYYRVKEFTNGVERAVVFEIDRLHGACDQPERSYLPRRGERWVFSEFDFLRRDGEAYEALVRDSVGNRLYFEVSFATDCDDANAIVNFQTVELSSQDLTGRLRVCDWTTEPPFDDPAARCQ